MEKILTLDKIEKTAKSFIEDMGKGDKNIATVLALYGDLGVGKTTITKEIAKQLGILEKVISPTFVIMKIYKTKNKKFKNLIHIDAYRLEKSKEIEQLGFEDLLKNKDNLIIIEWPEKVEEYLPSNTHRIILEHKDDTTRIAKFCYN
ncbi:MAG: tRNA (adenosine(37)-N6)-threonylcarbamoyltransferase complex ATPase subunit type 1 TsaE [Candidatus Nomurabacteria bacterium]